MRPENKSVNIRRNPAVGDILTGGKGYFLRQWDMSRSSVSLAVVYLSIIVFLAVNLLDIFHLINREANVVFLGFSYIGILNRLWLHQFLTAPLLHGGVFHLVFNMLALWMLGPGLEQVLGRRRYIILVILCVECSLPGFLLLTWKQGNIFMGSSCLILGLLVAQAMYFPDSVITLFGLFPLKMKYAVLLLGGMELYLTVPLNSSGSVHAAHLFGAVAAYLYLRTITKKEKSIPADRPKIQKHIAAVNKKEIPREL